MHKFSKTIQLSVLFLVVMVVLVFFISAIKIIVFGNEADVISVYKLSANLIDTMIKTIFN